jgi:hypothetical protein
MIIVMVFWAFKPFPLGFFPPILSKKRGYARMVKGFRGIGVLEHEKEGFDYRGRRRHRRD